MVVRPRAQVRSLRDTNAVFDGDRRQREDADVFADPHVVPEREAPGERDVDVRPDHHPAARAGAELPEPEDPHPRGPGTRVLKEQTLDDQPARFFPAGSAAVEMGSRKTAEINARRVHGFRWARGCRWRRISGCPTARSTDRHTEWS